MKKKEYARPVAFVVSGEMIGGGGEDASYLNVTCSGGKRKAVMGVFDGCGGLGARKYASEGGMTGAYIASRLAARILGEYELVGSGSFEARLSEAFVNEKNRLENENGAPSVRSDMVKTLPTTACAAIIGDAGCEIGWLGDSRLYSLDHSGLKKLTADDGNFNIEETFYSDRRLTGYVNADSTFQMFTRRLSAASPRAWIAATDGFYAAYRTPMELEDMLLTTLSEADSPERWQELIAAEIDECASDDYTAVVYISGYSNFASFKKKLAARTKYISDRLKPLYSAGSDNERFTTAASDIWKDYRKDYLKQG